MSHLVLLAQNTFRESLRDRLLAILMLFGVVFTAAAVLIAPLTLGQSERIVRDLGLSAIGLFTTMMIIMVGTGMVWREIERRTILTILAHPVGRPSFILGKFFGLYGTVLVSIGVLGLFYLGVVALFGGGFEPHLVLAIAMIALEAAIVTAVAVLFSSVASPLLSAVFTTLVWAAGHMAFDLKMLAEKANSVAVDRAVDLFYLVLPSLHHFHVRNNVLADVPIPGSQLVWCATYTGLYCGAVLVVTILAFGRRDFE